MLSYIIRRLGATIVVMAVVAFFVFSLLYLTPGDPAAVIAGDVATAEDIARICHGHPTYSEALKEAALAATDNRALHI